MFRSDHLILKAYNRSKSKVVFKHCDYAARLLATRKVNWAGLCIKHKMKLATNLTAARPLCAVTGLRTLFFSVLLRLSTVWPTEKKPKVSWGKWRVEVLRWVSALCESNLSYPKRADCLSEVPIAISALAIVDLMCLPGSTMACRRQLDDVFVKYLGFFVSNFWANSKVQKLLIFFSVRCKTTSSKLSQQAGSTRPTWAVNFAIVD